VDYSGYGGFAPYVSVATRRRNAERHVAKLRKNGREVSPVSFEGRRRRIALTFWGQAWCDNLDSYAQLSNRLQRGRTYVRNGSVIDLQIVAGTVTSLVSGSEVYEVTVQIAAMEKRQWNAVVRRCAGKIDSVVELLRGQFSKGVMTHLCDRKTGLFPEPKEIDFECSCPDGRPGWMCKHVAATLYGVGARLDERPELLFTLRGVDHGDLISRAAKGMASGKAARRGKTPTLETNALAEVFGIEIDLGEARPERKRRQR
jgi:uncharacterized Zn finger protein